MSPTTRTDWTPTKWSKIVILRENAEICWNSERSYAEIARQVGGLVTKSGVRKLWLRYGKTISVKNKAKSGRKRITNAIDDR